MSTTQDSGSNADFDAPDDGQAKRKDRLSFANDVVWSLGFDGLTIVANIIGFLSLIHI